MSEYLLQQGTRSTPQSERMRSDQVPNSAGGFSWAVDEWTRLRRFLILGSEGGSYYATEKQLTFENVQAVRNCLKEDGPRTVAEIVAISDSGRAPKNDPALYALAAAISLGDKETKRAAAEALPKVARIGTHLYHFVAYAETMRGWGRTLRWAVSNWYARNPDQLALQAVKYRQRDGWTHRDLLRLAHPKNDANAAIFDWITHGISEEGHPGEFGGLIEGFEFAQKSASPETTAKLIRDYKLPREAVLPEHLTSIEVWAALLDAGMPMTAMLRNLATMTRVGILDAKEYRVIVKEALGNQESIKRSRLHPLAILIGLRTYASGHGFRGSNTWTPKPDVIDALDEAFYLAFDNVEPTGKSILLALDVSGSMWGGNVAGSPLTPAEASAAMALVTLHVEDDVEVVGFHSGSGTFSTGQNSGYSWRNSGIGPISLSRRQRLDDAVKNMSNYPFGGTDCSLPFLYAANANKRFEGFVVLTDSETWAGNIHPKQALDQYRQSSGINARSVVVGMVANSFSIADPADAGMLDCCGFDTATPQILSDFIAGKI